MDGWTDEFTLTRFTPKELLHHIAWNNLFYIILKKPIPRKLCNLRIKLFIKNYCHQIIHCWTLIVPENLPILFSKDGKLLLITPRPTKRFSN